MKVIERATMPDGTEISAGRLVRQKYRRVSGFIWADYWCISNSKEHWKIWMGTEWRIIPYTAFHRTSILAIPMMMCGRILKH